MWHFRRHRRQVWRPVFLGLGLLALVGTVVAKDEPPTVTVVQAVKREVTDYATFTGHLQAAQKVELRPRISGVLEKIHFKPGALVKKGDLLFEIDARPLKAALEKAEAELALAQARAKLAEKNLARVRRLRGSGAASQEDLDTAEATHAERQAAIKLVRASVQTARVTLDFTRVTAPIDGKIGLPMVTPGNVVAGDGPGSIVLATIVSLDPVYVCFDIDERTFLRLKRLGRDRQLGKGSSPLAMNLADEKGFPHKGEVDGIDNHVNAKTGAIRVRGAFANPNGLFQPGMFVKVRLPVSKPYAAVVVIKDAVLWHLTMERQSVLVLNHKNVLEERWVQAGPLIERTKTDWQVVLTGLKEGEWVVRWNLASLGLCQGMKIKPTREQTADR